MRKISIIAAVDKNWLIGKGNALAWKLPADLKHFKSITTGHSVIMGRKTYDSIGKPLPDRVNIVISKNELNIPGCITVKSIDEALAAAPIDREIFIIGGGEIYRQFLPMTDRIYLTRVHSEFEGDRFFPELNLSEWKEIERKDHKADEKNPYDYSFLVLERTRG